MIQVAPGTKVHLACRPVSMRYGFDGLAAKAASVLDRDPFSEHPFCFRSKPALIVAIDDAAGLVSGAPESAILKAKTGNKKSRSEGADLRSWGKRLGSPERALGGRVPRRSLIASCQERWPASIGTPGPRVLSAVAAGTPHVGVWDRTDRSGVRGQPKRPQSTERSRPAMRPGWTHLVEGARDQPHSSEMLMHVMRRSAL
jgi:hypothetical protein